MCFEEYALREETRALTEGCSEEYLTTSFYTNLRQNRLLKYEYSKTLQFYDINFCPSKLILLFL